MSIYVLCGYEIWSLTVREKHWLRVFECKMLVRISVSSWDQELEYTA
jgi:hypothetical protein